MDIDKDGVVDINEFELGLQSRGDLQKLQKTNSFVVQTFEKANSSKDGVLDKDEFIELMKTDDMQKFFAEEQVLEDKIKTRLFDLN